MMDKHNSIKNYILEKIEYLSINFNQTFSEEEVENLVNFYVNNDNEINVIKQEIDEKISEVESLYIAKVNEPYDYMNAKTFYSVTLDTGEVIPIATYHLSDNELHLHSAIPNNDEGRLHFERLRQYIRDKYYSNSGLTDVEIKRLAKIEHEDKIIEDALCSLLPILEKNKHLNSVSLETNEYFAKYVSDVFRSYGFSWEKRSDSELEELGLDSEMSKDRTDVLKCDREFLIENIHSYLYSQDKSEEENIDTKKVLTLKNPETNNSDTGKVNYFYILLVTLLIVTIGIAIGFVLKK